MPPSRRPSLRSLGLALVLLLAVVGALQLHACACTGGAPTWRSIATAAVGPQDCGCFRSGLYSRRAGPLPG